MPNGVLRSLKSASVRVVVNETKSAEGPIHGYDGHGASLLASPPLLTYSYRL